MSTQRCLYATSLRVIDNALPRVGRLTSTARSNPFSTSSSHRATAPEKGVKRLTIKKKGGGPPEKTGKPPEPGERKAFRKRIVLSNTNAIRVKDLHDLDPHGKDYNPVDVFVLSDDSVDKLRAVEAFKPRQSWHFFQRPALLTRTEGKEIFERMDAPVPPRKSGNDGVHSKGKESQGIVVVGEKGAGKSVLLLQAMMRGFQQEWVVISIPEARDLVIGSTAFTPVPGSDTPLYSQPNYTAKLLSQILAANQQVLSKLKLSAKPDPSLAIKEGITLDALVKIGIDNPDRAWPIFDLFWKELTVPNEQIDSQAMGRRPPILMCLDNMAYVLNDTKYQTLDPQTQKLKPIHALKFTLIKHFFDQLSGKGDLPNGGLVLAATSESDAPKSHGMDVGIARAESRQLNHRSPYYRTTYTSQQRLDPSRTNVPVDDLANFWSPYEPLDTQSLNALDNVKVMRVKGLSKAEATSMMVYWANNGMLRGQVVPWSTDRAWAAAGGGVFAGLEEAAVKFLQSKEEDDLERVAGAKRRQR